MILNDLGNKLPAGRPGRHPKYAFSPSNINTVTPLDSKQRLILNDLENGEIESTNLLCSENNKENIASSPSQSKGGTSIFKSSLHCDVLLTSIGREPLSISKSMVLNGSNTRASSNHHLVQQNLLQRHICRDRYKQNFESVMTNKLYGDHNKENIVINMSQSGGFSNQHIVENNSLQTRKRGRPPKYILSSDKCERFSCDMVSCDRKRRNVDVNVNHIEASTSSLRSLTS